MSVSSLGCARRVQSSPQKPVLEPLNYVRTSALVDQKLSLGQPIAVLLPPGQPTDVLSPRMVRNLEDLAPDWRRRDDPDRGRDRWKSKPSQRAPTAIISVPSSRQSAMALALHAGAILRLGSGLVPKQMSTALVFATAPRCAIAIAEGISSPHEPVVHGQHAECAAPQPELFLFPFCSNSVT